MDQNPNYVNNLKGLMWINLAKVLNILDFAACGVNYVIGIIFLYSIEVKPPTGQLGVARGIT